ncbi:IS481 family transposase, partial [Rhodococcus sp. NPDC058521]
MARSDARMKLLDASLKVAHERDADMFDGSFKAWCAENGIARATAYRHRKRILEEGRWTERSRRPSSSPLRT